MALTNTSLTDIFSSVYTSTGDSAVTVIYICNTSSITVFVTVCLVPRPQIVDDQQHAIYYNIPVAANDTYIIDSEKIILEHGDSIQIRVNSGYIFGTTRIIASVSSIAI